MTEQELREKAKEMGFTLVKKPCYDCTCYVTYPNINHRNRNGKWKCVDKYVPVKFEKKYGYQPVTRCMKKGEWK